MRTHMRVGPGQLVDEATAAPQLHPRRRMLDITMFAGWPPLQTGGLGLEPYWALRSRTPLHLGPSTNYVALLSGWALRSAPLRRNALPITDVFHQAGGRPKGCTLLRFLQRCRRVLAAGLVPISSMYALITLILYANRITAS